MAGGTPTMPWDFIKFAISKCFQLLCLVAILSFDRGDLPFSSFRNHCCFYLRFLTAHKTSVMSKTRESQKRKLSGKESEDRTLDIIEGTSKGKDETSTCKENQGTLNSEGKTGSPRKRSRLKDKRPSCKNGAKNGDNGNWISNDETVSRSKDRTQNGEDENQSGQDQTKSTDTGTSTQDKEVTLNKLSHSSDNMDRKPASVNRLPFSYFDKDCVELAKSLLGQKLVHFVNGKRLVGKIVETEAYVGLEDKAAHSYNGKRTARNKAMFMAPGTAYVYNIYGMYCCLNISSKGLENFTDLWMDESMDGWAGG